MSPKEPIVIKELRPKTLLLGVYSPTNQFQNKDAYFEEFISLVKTLGLGYDLTFFMKVRILDHSHFLTKGKMEEVRKICRENEIEEVICSEALSSLQERNFSDALECTISDRERLILEIFKKSAHTAEGKVQVEIAELEFLKTRTSGQGKHLAQQAGYIGTRGPGETLKESLTRYYATRIRQAKKRLENLERSKNIQRKRRLESHVPFITLIGYTNSGKSSILNRLTKADVLVEDKLFATLDTTTKKLFLTPEKTVLLSDTVGFISDLPHHLINAFKSTLDELQYSDLLLLVVDVANEIWQDQVKVAHKILEELNVKKPIAYVFNKIDKIENIEEI